MTDDENADVLIIGYGNTLCGDDGLGPLAAEHLAAGKLPPGCKVMACQQLTLELAEDISAAEFVLFLDAREGDPAGQLDCAIVRPGRNAPGPLEHHTRPTALLAAAGALGGHVPPAMLLTVRSTCFRPGSGLSAEGQASLPLLVGCAASLAKRIIRHRAA